MTERFITLNRSFVKQERKPASIELDKFRPDRRFDLLRRLPALDPIENILIDGQPGVTVHLPVVWVEFSECRRDLDAGADRFESIAIGDYEINAVEVLVLEDRRVRLESDRHESNAGKIPLIQIPCKLLAIHPRSAKNLERRVGSTADADVRCFE